MHVKIEGLNDAITKARKKYFMDNSEGRDFYAFKSECEKDIERIEV